VDPRVVESFGRNKVFNAGIFAMPSRSPIWARYQAHLQVAIGQPFDHLREQDSLNLAIFELGARRMPSTLNWLCSLALLIRVSQNRWVTPDDSQRTVQVAHLTNSEHDVPHKGRIVQQLEVYRENGLC